MNTDERRAILAISLMAAFADGGKHEREREQIRRIAESLEDPQVNPAALYQDVLLRRIDLDQAAGTISSPELRQYAYEMAVCVCDADGAHSPQETGFLERLARALELGPGTAESFTRDADRIAALPVTTSLPGEPDAPTTVDQPLLDRMVLNYAILNGALELLPQNLASVAIIPLQIKMVYRIGKAYGYELDRGHIKDFLATLGVGMASQYLEQIGRKLISGLLGQVAGGLGRGLGGAATGAAFSFATTYALGQVARRYYADGRTLSADTLRQSYAALLEQAKGVQGRYLPEIQQKARTLDINQVMQAVRH